MRNTQAGRGLARLLLSGLALMSGLALGGLAVAACGDSAPPPPRWNVLVLTLDTVRADRLGAYGHTARDITPHLDALAAESVLFEQAFSNSSFTPPTHASIFTGLLPAEHGLLHWNYQLAKGVKTAAEIFSEAGYRTGAFTPMQTLLSLGLRRGFEEKQSPPYQKVQTALGEQVVLADADALNAAALPWLTSSSSQPFFAWIHYYDAHRPYGRQGAEWAGRYTERDDFRLGAEAVGAIEQWYQLTPAKRAAMGLTPEQTQIIKDKYDGGLSYLDDRVGRLLAELRRSGVLERTLLIVLADHGEVLDEHEEEWFSHDPHLWTENTHIPLLIRFPDGMHAKQRVPGLVSQVDVLPTLLDLFRLPPGDPEPAGRSLLPFIEVAARGETLPPRVVLADRIGDDRVPENAPPERLAQKRDHKRSVRKGEHLLLVEHDRGNRTTLHTVEGGAREARDISADEPKLLEQLLRIYGDLLSALRRPADTQSSDLDENDRIFLDQMGY
ncbi:MAG: sulfatase [Planctomycetota bacterium]